MRHPFERLISSGTLVVHMPGGRRVEVGAGAPVAEMFVRRRQFLSRLFLDPEIALGEGYVDGDWEPGAGGLAALFDLYCANAAHFTSHRLLDVVRRAGRSLSEAIPRTRAAANVERHYDLDHTLFEQFLDPDLHYSCAYFERAEMSLEEAQAAKCRHIANKLCLRPGQRVLDVGCGWGGLARYLARTHGVAVTGLTLSHDQYTVARARAVAAGLERSVRILREDYRSHAGTYDAVVSVGMFEHVGRLHYAEYFAHIAGFLVPGGRALVHTIGRNGPPPMSNRSWIEKHVFPGCYIPSLSDIAPDLERSGLGLSDLEVWRQHYARTLSVWQARFDTARAGIDARLGPRLGRTWAFYLAICEAMFRTGNLVVFQLQLARENDTVPVTRDYLYLGAARTFAQDKDADRRRRLVRPLGAASRSGRRAS